MKYLGFKVLVTPCLLPEMRGNKIKGDESRRKESGRLHGRAFFLLATLRHLNWEYGSSLLAHRGGVLKKLR
jgi:hypothetical protein